MAALGLFALSPGQALAQVPARSDSLASESRADSIPGFRATGVMTPQEMRFPTEPDRAQLKAIVNDIHTSFPPTSFPPPRVRAWQVGLLRGDRLEHASFAFAVASSVIIATRNRAAGATTAFAIGLGKEFWDGRTGHFDPVDLAADAVGIALATLLVAPRGP